MPPKTIPAKKKQHKLAKQDAHLQTVLAAALRTVAILNKHGLSCAVFGSLASKLYGAPRCPKDVDMLILQDKSTLKNGQAALTADELKALILNTDSQHFFLTLPRDPTAPYRILHFRQSYGGPQSKVDILVPGTMHLPSLPSSSLTWVAGIPLVPFSLLLLHKLQGWDDHRLAEEPHKQKKQGQDAADMRRLTALNEHMGLLVVPKKVGAKTANRNGKAVAVDLEDPVVWWADTALFSEEFQELTVGRVEAYCRAFPERVGPWRSLGFEPDLTGVDIPLAVKAEGEGTDGLEEAIESLRLNQETVAEPTPQSS